MEKKSSEITYREIYLQPDSLSAINDSLDGIYEVLEQVFAEKYDELIFTGYGTSLYLVRTVAHASSTYDAVPAEIMCCSELCYSPESYVGDRKIPMFPITRRSYTTEARMAIDKVRSFLGVRALAVTCDGDSILCNDYVAFSPDTAEDSAVMTCSFTSMVYLAAVIAMYVGGQKDEIGAMAGYAANTQDALKKTGDTAKKIMTEHEYPRLYITLGQGIFYGVVNEYMNKMKEMGLINSEVYCTLEYRHGPMSFADEDTLVLLLGGEHTADGDSKLLIEMRSYGAVTAAVSNHTSADFVDADCTLDLPYGYNDAQNTALIGFISQFMRYYIAEKKGLDADTPRYLSQAIIIKQEKI